MYIVTIHNGDGSALEGATPVYVAMVGNKTIAEAAVAEIDKRLQRDHPHDDSWAQWSLINDTLADFTTVVDGAMKAYDEQYGE